MYNILFGILLSFIVSYLAYKKGSLNYSGFIGALILGSLLYYLGGFFFWIIMISFFISSSILTKFKGNNKKETDDLNEKNGKRDYIQVLSNGGLGLIFAFMYNIYNDPIYMVGFATAFAASNADTWASELGVLSKREPISIINFKKTERGVSGSISIFGIIASLLGAFFIAIVFTLGLVLKYNNIDIIYKYILIISICGFLGSIIDSYLGSLIQVKYKCGVCNKITEKKIHHGEITSLIKGIKWFNNDLVNFTSGALASLISIVLFNIS